jgi:hypothetical protein
MNGKELREVADAKGKLAHEHDGTFMKVMVPATIKLIVDGRALELKGEAVFVKEVY